MSSTFSQIRYEEEINAIFQRFPSVQNVPFADAYKPGLDRMIEFNELLGNPDKKFRVIHVAGTNGKGSVSNMLASALSANGYKTGIYTSPHISDFRERMRVIGEEGQAQMVSREYVYDFILKYRADFERLSLSFFEITTGMALKWFADSAVDYVVLEVGLGGRLDSTNIVSPLLSIITSIGLDHCDLLGNTLAEIAAEKAGIIKKGKPVIIGETHPQTAPVFAAKAKECESQLFFAEEECSEMEQYLSSLHSKMDLCGEYQIKNLRTVFTVLDYLDLCNAKSEDAIISTAARMQFHGRWEQLSCIPKVICDIGHNAHALKNNFSQLEKMLVHGNYSSLIIIYAIMADKDLDAIMPLFPTSAIYHFTTPASRRSLPACKIKEKYQEFLSGMNIKNENLFAHDSVQEAIEEALAEADKDSLIYIGGSTFAVSEAVDFFKKD